MRARASLARPTLHRVLTRSLKTMMFAIFVAALLVNVAVHRLIRMNTETSKNSANRLDRISRVLFPFVLYPLLIVSMVVIGFARVGAGIAVGATGLVCFILAGIFFSIRLSLARGRAKRDWMEFGLARLERDISHLNENEEVELNAFLQKAFNIFDEDKSRTLDKPEILELVGMMHKSARRPCL